MTETVKEMLDRMEKDLSTQIADLRRKLVPLERELADVRRAYGALQRDRSSEKRDISRVFMAGGGPAKVAQEAREDTETLYRGLTMKQLTLKALKEHFTNGATANELLEYFANAWGRNDIIRESFSPQLSRLKREGKISLRGKVWYLLSPENETPDVCPSGVPGGESSASPSSESQGVHQEDIFS